MHSVSEQDRFLRMPEIRQITGLSRAHIYQLIAKGDFPRQYKLGERAAAWLQSEISEWMSVKIGDTRGLTKDGKSL